jgi:DNA polymerase III subunit gamma/tau
VQQVSRGSTLLSTMQYQVLARKWRPRNFHELVGQEHVSRTLMNALQSGRLAHAFLFSGPRGSGKTTSARILAKALNCHDGKPGEPCSSCVACTEIAAGNCMDVLEIDAASNRGIDEIRELKEKARYNPARDRNKIFIIDEVHMLTSEAFNALLKILEEPPPHVVFILATTEYHKIPATILSRCQQYSFKLIQYPLILNRLREISKAEGINIADSALEQVVFSSGGSMRDAMSALDQVIAFSGSEVLDADVAALLGMVEPKVLSRTVHAIAEDDLPVLLQTVATLVEAGQDLNNFCRRLSGQFRNLMVMKSGISDPALLGIPESLLPELRVQADLFSREDLLRLFDAFQKIEIGLKYASQVRFQLEMGLIELAHVARLRSLEDLVAEFSAFPEDTAPQKRESSGHTSGVAAKSQTLPAVLPKTDIPAVSFKPPAPVMRKPIETVPETRPVVSPAVPEPGLDVPTVDMGDPREFLLKIAAAEGLESLEALMHSFNGAQLKGNQVVLDPGSVNEFSRGQVQQKLPVIAQAASQILGYKVTAVLGTVLAHPGPKAAPVRIPAPRSRQDAAPESDLLEQAKREPVVKSFLDVFPGPVKAEKIDK